MLKNLANQVEEDKNIKLLQKIDIFGIGINIKFNQESKHKTRFGGFITLILGGLLFLLFSSSIQEMIYKRNPKVVYEQKIVTNPSRFDLTKQNFSFMVTLLDSTFQPISDESIFRVEGNFLYKERTTNPDGTLGQAQFKNKEIELELCTENSFQVENTQEYFRNLPYQKMYCVKNIEEFYLVGQFEMNEFSVIEFRVIPCQSNDPKNKVQCMDSVQQNSILTKSILQIYYSTQVVQVSNKNEPFKSVGQSYFWESNIDYQQNINLLYINTFVEDDEGLFIKDINSRSSLLFSSERTMMSSKEDLSFFKLSIYLEKNKEQYYTRSYLKIPNAISEVGGLYNVLFAIGCLIAQPYSQMQFHRKLFNSTFQISKSNQKKQNQSMNNSTSSPNNNQNNNNNINNSNNNNGNEQQQEGEQESRKKTTTFQSTASINKQLSPLRKQSNNKTKTQKTLKRQVSVFETNKDSKPQQQDSKNDSMKGFIKNQLRNMSVKTSEYISYYLNCFNLFKSEVYEIVNFGTKQIYNYTDICFIVNKLLEFEKLKNIVLNDQQIKLFDFIPKPKIDIQLIKNIKRQALRRSIRKKQNSTSQDKEIDNDTDDQASVQNQELNSYFQDKKRQFNILSMQNRPISYKAQQAQTAFNNIYKHQEKKSKIDLKLIQMLDENLIQLFHKNMFEENNVAGSIFLFNQQNNINIPSDQTVPQLVQANSKIEKQMTSNQNSFCNLKHKNIKPIVYNSMEDKHDDKYKEIVSDAMDTSEVSGAGFQLYNNQPKNFISYTEMRNKNLYPQLSNDSILQTRFMTQKTQNQQDTLNDSYINNVFQI